MHIQFADFPTHFATAAMTSILVARLETDNVAKRTSLSLCTGQSIKRKGSRGSELSDNDSALSGTAGEKTVFATFLYKLATGPLGTQRMILPLAFSVLTLHKQCSNIMNK